MSANHNGLTRMRESFIMSPGQATTLTDEQINHIQGLRESLKNVDKIQQRIHESVDAKSAMATLAALRESNDNAEFRAAIDKITKGLADAGNIRVWRVPVARYDVVNGNGRNYPKALWENVIQNQRNIWQGFLGLCDHPKEITDAGDLKNTAVVWYDMQLDPNTNIVWGICTFVGVLGALVQQILEVGGRVGFSTSGFGKTLYDGVTVDPDTFQIERVADVVLNPSQGVFGDLTDQHETSSTIDYTKKEPVRESMGSSAIINAAVAATNPAQGGAQPAPAATPNQPAPAQPTAQPAAQPAQPAKPAAAPAQPAAQPAQPAAAPAQPEKKQESLKTGLSANEAFITTKYVEKYLEHDLAAIPNVQDRLEELRNIREQISYAEINEGLREKVDAMITSEQETLRKMVEAGEIINRDLADDLTKFPEQAKTMALQAKFLSDENADYKQLSEAMGRQLRSLTKQLREAQTENARLRKLSESKGITAQRENVAATYQVAALQAELSDMKESLMNSETRCKELRESKASLSSRVRMLEHDNSMLSRTNRMSESNSATNQNHIAELEATVKRQAEQIERLQNRITEATASAAAAKKEFTEFKEQLDYENNPMNHLVPSHAKQISSFLNFREGQGDPVENYWVDLKNRYHEAILPYETKIRNAKTLREAQQAFFKYSTDIDKDARAAQLAKIPCDAGANKAIREALEKEAGMNLESGRSLDQETSAFLAMCGDKPAAEDPNTGK